MTSWTPIALALGLVLMPSSLLARTTAGTQEGETAREPRAPYGLGGIAGFSSRSTLVLGDSEEAPARLETVHMHPDRVRWRRTDAEVRTRSMHYRFGERAWRLPENATQAVELKDDERDLLLLGMELRGAAMLWPLGFDWSPVPDHPLERTAGVDLCRSHSDRIIGSLLARLDESGRPVRLIALDLEDREVQEIHIGGWFESAGRAWPRKMELVEGGSVMWTETLEEVHTTGFYVDSFFLPEHLQPPTLHAQRISEVDLFPITFRAQEFAVGTTWSAALPRCREWIDDARKEVESAGFAIDPVPCIELGPAGEPRRCLIRLSAPSVPPPAGWSTRAAGRGLATFVDGIAAITQGSLRGLLARVPQGKATGTPYCRLVRAEGPRSVQLYLPLVPESKEPEDS